MSLLTDENPIRAARDPQAGRFADADASYGRALLLVRRTHGETRHEVTSDERDDVASSSSDLSFLEASTLSNRALTARRLARFSEALDDATRARRKCATKTSEARFERLTVKVMCTQADALANLGRAWDACGVLRSALRRLARSLARPPPPGEDAEEEKRVARRDAIRRDVAFLRAALRRHVERVPMRVLCDHWAFALESAVVPSDASGRETDARSSSPLSARQSGRLMRPEATGRERRATTAESSRRLRDAIVGAEPRWRAFTAEAWIRACAASAAIGAASAGHCVSDLSDVDGADGVADRREEPFPFGTGAGARFALHRARALVYRGKGDVAQFARDARTSAAYAPEAPKGNRKEALAFGLDPAASAFASEAGAGSAGTSAAPAATARASARLAAEARALLAEAYEAVSDAAERRVASASPERGRATRHFLRAASAENDADDACAKSRVVSVSPGETRDETEFAMGRVVLSPAGEEGRSDALVVDAGVAAAVEWRRATELDPADAAHAHRLRVACAKHLRGFGAGLVDALVSPGGSSAAIAWLEADKWRHAPEYVRPRPKYYYFYEMMREKIEAHYPSLPPPVMDKLLATDADELDLLLQYPEAIRGQTEEYLQVLRERGAEALGTYKTPTLTWEEVRALKGGDGVVGLGASGETTGGESVVAGRGKKKAAAPALPSVAEEGGATLVSGAEPASARHLASAKTKMDRARAFSAAYGGEASAERVGEEDALDGADAVSDPDEPEEDTDRAALGAGGDDGLTDLEQRGLRSGAGDATETEHARVGSHDDRDDARAFGDALPPDQFRARAARFPPTKTSGGAARRAAARFAATEIEAMDEMD